MNANTTDTLRLFFALWPDDTTRAALQQLQVTLQGRIIPYGNLHLTLAFLGQQPTTLVGIAKDILSHLSSPPISMTLDRMGYFARNRIAWVGTHQVPAELLALHKELAEALRQREITFDSQQNFKPHITLARDASPPPDTSFTPIAWHASRVALVQSVTNAEGARYQVVASRSLDEKCWTPDERGLEGDAAQ
ncbi:MAG TPA: RNA 2',3'-cyclic phosphodiesterase [Noviherbaspirillum sp.]|nr:RNA 2',3'-cyclic phosphodiesterase [Noviherbaspirillum sp.]